MIRHLPRAALGLAAVFLAAGVATAHPPGGQPPTAGYYGNGPHDQAPHWHKTLSPYGPVYWYGNGAHDLRPHQHRITPWGGTTGYSPTPFGPTKSYNGFPPGYGRWSGSTPFGNYGGGFYGGRPGYGSNFPLW